MTTPKNMKPLIDALADKTMQDLKKLMPFAPKTTIKRLEKAGYAHGGIISSDKNARAYCIGLVDRPCDPNCKINMVVLLKPRGFLSRLCYAPTYYWKARKLRLFRKRALRATLLYIKGA